MTGHCGDSADVCGNYDDDDDDDDDDDLDDDDDDDDDYDDGDGDGDDDDDDDDESYGDDDDDDDDDDYDGVESYGDCMGNTMRSMMINNHEDRGSHIGRPIAEKCGY